MNKDQIFSAWAPEASVWSPWVKPVLFAHMDTLVKNPYTNDAMPEQKWLPPVEKGLAMIVELPGVASVAMGMALAERGFRPVPLFNAIPYLAGPVLLDAGARRMVAAVNVLPIMAALQSNTDRLATLPISPAAPPVFLLDDRRQANLLPAEFDNRSVCFTTDFPSANFLLAQGIQRALVVQNERLELQADLAHVLRRWQDGGIKLEIIRCGSFDPAVPLQVAKPTWYGAMFQRALISLGLHRARGGGFGAWVPESSAGG